MEGELIAGNSSQISDKVIAECKALVELGLKATVLSEYRVSKTLQSPNGNAHTWIEQGRQ